MIRVGNVYELSSYKPGVGIRVWGSNKNKRLQQVQLIEFIL